MCDEQIYNFGDLNLDFLDITTPPRQTTTAVGAPRVATPYMNHNLLSSKLQQKQATILPRQTERVNKARKLSQHIANTDALVKQVQQLETDRIQLQQKLKDFQQSAKNIQNLYETERRQRRQLQCSVTELQSKCELLDAEVANKTLHNDQLQSQVDESKGPIDYGGLVIKFLKLTNKLDDDQLLHWHERSLVDELQLYCQHKQLKVPIAIRSPKKSRKPKKIEKSIQCELLQQQPAAPQSCSQGTQCISVTRSQGTQHIGTTTTRSTSTASFIKKHNVGTSFPEPPPLPPFNDIIQELLMWDSISPISPLADVPSTLPPPQHLVTVRKHTVGTCTFLCNIQRQIDFIPMVSVAAGVIKNSNSRPPSRLMCDASIKREAASATPSPTLTQTHNTSNNNISAASSVASNATTSQSFLQFYSSSSIANLPPHAFEELWQVFGQMLLGLLQNRNSSLTTASTANTNNSSNSSTDALSQQQFHNWMRSLYDNVQEHHLQQTLQSRASSPAPAPIDTTSVTPLESVNLVRPQARRNVFTTNVDIRHSPIEEEDQLSTLPQQHSIGTSPIRFNPAIPNSVQQSSELIATSLVENVLPRTNNSAFKRLPLQQHHATVPELTFEPHHNSTSNHKNTVDESNEDGNQIITQFPAKKKSNAKNLIKKNHRKTKKCNKIKKHNILNNYIESGEACDNCETAVDFLARLGCITKSKNPEKTCTSDNNVVVKDDIVKLDSQVNHFSDIGDDFIAGDIGESVDVLIGFESSNNTRFGKVSQEERNLALEARIKVVREWEHSLFGSDTDVSDEETTHLANKQEARELNILDHSKPTESSHVIEINNDKIESNLTVQQMQVNDFHIKTASGAQEAKHIVEMHDKNNCKHKQDTGTNCETQNNIKILNTNTTTQEEALKLDTINKADLLMDKKNKQSFQSTIIEISAERNMMVDESITSKELINKTNILMEQNKTIDKSVQSIRNSISLLADEKLNLRESTSSETNSIIEISSDCSNIFKAESIDMKNKIKVNDIERNSSKTSQQTTQLHDSLIVEITVGNSQAIDLDSSNNILKQSSTSIVRTLIEDPSAQLFEENNSEIINAYQDTKDITATTDTSVSNLLDTTLYNSLFTDSVEQLITHGDMIITPLSIANEPKKRGRKRKSESAPTSIIENVTPCKRSARIRAKQLVLDTTFNLNLSTPPPPTIELGKYTKNQNVLKNIVSQPLQISSNTVVDDDIDDADDTPLQIDLGYFKECDLNESINTTTSTNCDNIKIHADLLKGEPFDTIILPQKKDCIKDNFRYFTEQHRKAQKHQTCDSANDNSMHVAASPINSSHIDSSVENSTENISKSANSSLIQYFSCMPWTSFYNEPTDKESLTVVKTATSLFKVDEFSAACSKIECKQVADNSLDTSTAVDQKSLPYSEELVPLTSIEEADPYNYSPASPTTTDILPAVESVLPKDIPLELNVTYSSHQRNSLIVRLVTSYNIKYYQPYNSRHFAAKQEVQRQNLLSQLSTVLHNYLTENVIIYHPDVEAINLIKCLQRISENNYELIATAIVKKMREVPRSEVEVTCSIDQTPNIGAEQNRISTAIQHLHYSRPEFTVELLTKIEQTLFKYTNIEKITLNAALNLTQLYLLAIGYNKLSMNPARLFLAKCLYYYQLRAIPMTYLVLCAFPTTIPHREDRTYDRSNALITVIQHILMCTKYDMDNRELLTKELLSKLRFHYHFEVFKPDYNEVLTNLVDKLKAGKLTPELPMAFALFCKRQAQLRVQNNILEEHLLPLCNEYYPLVLQSSEYDERLAALLTCISMIVKAFPANTDVSVCLALFSRFLTAVDRSVVQEAALHAILRLQRFGYVNCFIAVLPFKPAYDLQPNTKAALLTFLYRKPASFWRTIKLQSSNVD